MKNEKDFNITDNTGNADGTDDMCDIYVSKVCDSCGECLGLNESDYRVVRIDGILKDVADINEEIDIDEYILDDTTLDKELEFEEDEFQDVEYIEDIPEVKKEYDKKIDTLLGRE